MKRLGPNDRCACNSGKKVKKCCIVSFVYTPEEIIERKKKKENLARWLEEDDAAAKENLNDFNSLLIEWKKGHPKEKIPLTGPSFNAKVVPVVGRRRKSPFLAAILAGAALGSMRIN